MSRVWAFDLALEKLEALVLRAENAAIRAQEAADKAENAAGIKQPRRTRRYP